MSPHRPSVWRRLVTPGLLAVTTGAMVLCARAPAAGAAWRTGFVVAALVGFGLLAVAWWRGGMSRRGVLGLAVLLRLIAFPLPPALSDDGFRYVWDGLVQVELGVSPYRYAPAEPSLESLHDEAIYDRLNSSGYYSVYPPLSQLVFALGGLFYPFGWMASWYLIKLLFVAAELAGVWLLSRMVSARALVLYAWNPLVVMEAAGQGHTEALAAPLLLLAVWLAWQGRGVVSAATLAAAGWVKLLPFVLVPFVVRRFGLRAAAAGVLVAAALALPYAAPDVPGHVRESLALYVRLFEFNAGPYYASKGLLGAATGEDWGKTLGLLLQWTFILSLPPLYALDQKRPRTLASLFAVTLGLFLTCATTVHPWYLLPLLALVPLLVHRPAGRLFGAAWLWLAAGSMATYWRYAGPEWGYTAAVAVGWTGWALLMAGAGLALALPTIMRRRAERKWRWIHAHLPGDASVQHVLDLGAGDGYVGEVVQQRAGAEVALADVVDFNRTTLPFVRYDGRTLPFQEGRFDLTLLVYVLHHAEDPEAVLREAGRVTRGYVAVVESVAEGRVQRRLFALLDRLANALRSGGAMAPHTTIRSDAAWRDLFDRLGLRVVASDKRGRGVHRQRFYCLEPLLP